jgi:UDPglucose--hexose-1-phosphate uridylyltransferase
MGTEEELKAQYRYDPFLKEWVIFTPTRGNRPFQGKTFLKEEKKTWTCPFCPDAPEGAGEWVVKQLPNRFAALDETVPGFVENSIGPIYKWSPNYGKCEVILYSQDHNQSFGNLTLDNIEALIKLWMERFQAIRDFPQIQYIFIMENRGKEIGNSMIHPHGQIYSFPFLPPKIKRKLDAFVEHKETNKNCLMCTIVAEELKVKKRIIEENANFLAFVPFYAHWSYEIHIVSKRHLPNIIELTSIEVGDLAKIMKAVVRRYDALIGDGKMMPYIMAMHNSPVNIQNADLWHYSIEYYTPYRGKDRWKFLAGVELGTNLFLSDNLPEEIAEQLRNLVIE